MRQHLVYDELWDAGKERGMFLELVVDSDAIAKRDSRRVVGLRIRRPEGQAGMQRKTIVAERSCGLGDLDATAGELLATVLA